MKSPSRDLRFDFYRGLALLMILIDHVEGRIRLSVFNKYTLGAWGWSDGAEVFIFISGYLYGLIYSRLLVNDGFASCQTKSLRRCLQLYVANAITLLVVLLIVEAFVIHNHKLVARLFLQPIVKNSSMAWLCMMPLLYVPYLFDVLRLYIVFLAIMPVFVWLTCQTRYLALVLSILLYTAAQQFSWFDIPVFFRDAKRFYFNPLAWQLLFVIGIVLGNYKRTGRQLLAKSSWFTVVAIGCLLAGLYFRLRPQWFNSYEQQIPIISWMFQRNSWLTEKSSLGPLRLFYFLCLAHVVASLIPATSSIWRSMPARPFIVCGRHSLEVFCLSIVLTYVMTIIGISFHLRSPAYSILMFISIVLLVCFASCLQRKPTGPGIVKTD